MMASQSNNNNNQHHHHHHLHFLLFPLMAPGHMIPMVDMARLIARHEGVTITILTTPHNASRFSKVINRARETEHLDIRVLELEFPAEEAGLPSGCENVDMLPSLGLATSFIKATSLFREKVESLLFSRKSQEDFQFQPSCIISDMVFPWTNEVAKRFNVPRIVFHGTCCFAQLCTHNLRKAGIVDKVESETEQFAVPGLDDENILLTKGQLPNNFKEIGGSEMQELREKMVMAEEESYGIVVNSFEELEPEYVVKYRHLKSHQKVWFIGPVSLCNNESYLDMIERGNCSTSSSSSDMDTDRCLKWLDGCEPGSVIYVCLGSLCPVNPAQMKELGLGLESSGKRFVWVIRRRHEELDEWMESTRFKENVCGRGMVIRGWAPQVLILSHVAIGGFMTHCGWNSTLEGVCAGKPMVTWPMFADQFYDERLIVQVLKIGVSVGVEETAVKFGEEDEENCNKVLVRKEDVARAVKELMISSVHNDEKRRRVGILAQMARDAVKDGGSSNANLRSLIEDIRRQTK